MLVDGAVVPARAGTTAPSTWKRDAQPRARQTTGRRRTTEPAGTSAPARQRPPTPAPSATKRRSGHAELVALRVVQRDGAAAHVVGPPGQRGARLDQPLHVLADQPLAPLAADLAPGHPDVEVDAILSRLGLRHALEIQPRPLARRVDPGGHLAPVRFRYPGRPGEVLPALEALRRRLDHVAQSQAPEFGQLLRLDGVEGHLDLGVHARAPDGSSTSATPSTLEGSARRAVPAARQCRTRQRWPPHAPPARRRSAPAAR